jgi:HD superfamily phosphodiesterase
MVEGLDAMRGSYADIFDLAMPYLDTRSNDVHTSISFQLALQLVSYYPEADKSVVLPAVILHDVGWKIIPEAEQLTAFGPNMSNPALRRCHEQEGARIAGNILKKLNYDPKKSEEIIAIIDGHDSRVAPLSLNDKLVKDADKLWRFTPKGVEIDHLRFGIERKVYLVWLEEQIDEWMTTPEAKQIARQKLDSADLHPLADAAPNRQLDYKA